MATGGGGGDGAGTMDRLSSLPDEVLRLFSAEAAAQTSLLSRRWRHLWTTLPELEFKSDIKLAAVRAALAAHAAPAIRRLQIMGGCRYLMEAIHKLATIEIMSLELSTRGHAFGHCVFHLLKMSTGIRKLKLALRGRLKDSQKQTDVVSKWFLGHSAKTRCSPTCICNQPQAWKTEDIFLDSLREVEISGLRGSEHELAFVKQLFRWAAFLKTLKVHLHLDLTVGDDLCKELLSLGTPDTDVKIYFFQAKTRPPWVLYTPVE
uniref:Uncharacterized protein n=1 Tax=Leersia perrieri TaxID=77586 RepID=A0A0D9WWX7_9ORYZ